MNLREPESNITGLFFFPKGDQMILILNIRRALTNPKPYDLAPFEYVVHMDLTTPVAFSSEEDRARYGGTVLIPENIHDDVTINFRLNNDTTVKGLTFTGLKNPENIRVYTGVRDDPFVFPRFFKKNVISMVLSIPMASFPQGQRDWVLWGSTYKDGKQVDHVGRSNRTQLGRFDALNTLPPNEHLKEIMKLLKQTNKLYNFFNGYKEWWSKSIAGLIQYIILIRKYDMAPDVMIYTNRFPPGFPNGRILPDDVAAQTCATGDCILQELSFVEGSWPRQTVNDKAFLADWPYIAEPWPDMAEKPPSTNSIWPLLIGLFTLIALVNWGVIEIIRRFFMWLWRKWRRKTAPAT